MTVIFEPVAQNTVVRPIAQAISLARGGAMVNYIDTSDKKRKAVDQQDLMWLDLKTNINGKQVPIKTDLVTFRAKHDSVEVLVLVNDITVKVTSQTTVHQAMNQFYKKLAVQNHTPIAPLPKGQREL